jgi:hypothetical protein
MNIIKIENVRKIDRSKNRLMIRNNYNFSTSVSTLVVLSEDDILNENCLLKLKGYNISALLIPKKYRLDFKNFPISKLIAPNLEENAAISYY